MKTQVWISFDGSFWVFAVANLSMSEPLGKLYCIQSCWMGKGLNSQLLSYRKNVILYLSNNGKASFYLTFNTVESYTNAEFLYLMSWGRFLKELVFDV